MQTYKQLIEDYKYVVHKHTNKFMNSYISNAYAI